MKNKLSEDMNFYKTSKFDIVIISLIILFSGVSMLGFARNRIVDTAQPKTILIYQQGKLLQEADLSKEQIITLLNGHMDIEVKGGKTRVLNADCPNHICKNTGWIKYSGETIACVPNKILIEIKSKGPSVVDAVAY